MKKLITVITLAALLASCGKFHGRHSNSYETSRGTIIRNNLGGQTWRVIGQIKKMKRPLMIHGQCSSSCTSAFRFEDTCVFPNAKVVFHAVTNRGKINEFQTRQLASYYPYNMRQWYLSHVFDNKNYVFTGTGMNRQFGTPICKY